MAALSSGSGSAAVVTWTTEFSVVSTFDDAGVTSVFAWSEGIVTTLNSSSFQSAVAASVNTTLTLDTDYLEVVTGTRHPSLLPTLMPSPGPTPIYCQPGYYAAVASAKQAAPALTANRVTASIKISGCPVDAMIAAHTAQKSPAAR